MIGYLIIAAFGIIPATTACFIKNKVVKAILFVVSFLALGILSLSIEDDYYFERVFVYDEYIYEWANLACVVVFITFMLIAWFPQKVFNLKAKRITAGILGVAIIVPIALYAVPQIYHDSIPVIEIYEEGHQNLFGDYADIPLTPYAPFGHYAYVEKKISRTLSERNLTFIETKAALLNEESTLKMQDNLPRLDGATALYPLYSAFVRATYPERTDARVTGVNNEYRSTGAVGDSPYPLYNNGVKKETLIVCSRTSGAFESLIKNEADIVFLMGISDEQFSKAKEMGLELTLTPIGREAFIFFVNGRNSATNLTTDDIKRIYSGEVTNWKEVGCKNNNIRAYQRPVKSGSQAMLQQIMDDTPIAPALEEDVYEAMLGMYSVVASYKNYKNSLGYSFMFYIKDMVGDGNDNSVKFLSINGIAPTHENIANNTYPYANDFHAVTVKRDGEYLSPERGENIDSLIEWILSEQGQYLVECTGYVPVR